MESLPSSAPAPEPDREKRAMLIAKNVPAPLNLVIPACRFTGPTSMVIG